MFRLIALAIGLATVLAWSRAEAQDVSAPPFDAKAQITVSKLRQFCAACHAVGSLRFIRSEDDNEVWQYIYLNQAPNSRKLWAQNIIDVLNWPSDAPPPFDQPMDPGNNRDWMPKGAKRLSLASDTASGQPTRMLMLEALKPPVAPEMQK